MYICSMYTLIPGQYKSAKDKVKHRVTSKPSVGSQSSSDEDVDQSALPPPHSSSSSSQEGVCTCVNV